MHYRLDSIHTVAAPHLTQTVGVPTQRSDGLDPENILLIGNETRAGPHQPGRDPQFGSPQQLSGSLSDVIMILHLDPKTGTASILSIPATCSCPCPPAAPVGPYQKIDAALNDGSNGPDNLIQAITDDLGIPINHFIELTFDGLQGVVNSLGGIKLDFPERLYDLESNLRHHHHRLPASRRRRSLSPGALPPPPIRPARRQRPAGRLALRPGIGPGPHRPRPHLPAGAGLDRGLPTGSPTPSRPTTSSARSSTTSSSTPGSAASCCPWPPITARSTRPPSPRLTLPITTVNSYNYAGSNIGDVDFPVQPLDNEVIAQWDGSALPTPAPPTSVPVYNLAGTYNLATDTTGRPARRRR